MDAGDFKNIGAFVVFLSLREALDATRTVSFNPGGAWEGETLVSQALHAQGQRLWAFVTFPPFFSPQVVFECPLPASASAVDAAASRTHRDLCPQEAGTLQERDSWPVPQITCRLLPAVQGMKTRHRREGPGRGRGGLLQPG